MKESTNVSQQRVAHLQQVTWQNVNEPGAYVETGTGNLYRFPPEALIAGSSPVGPAGEPGWRAPGPAITRPVHHDVRGKDVGR
jgi:hypothetical protein